MSACAAGWGADHFYSRSPPFHWQIPIFSVRISLNLEALPMHSFSWHTAAHIFILISRKLLQLMTWNWQSLLGCSCTWNGSTKGSFRIWQTRKIWQSWYVNLSFYPFLCSFWTCQTGIIWQSWYANLSFYPFLCPSLTCQPRIIRQYWVVNLSFCHPWGWVYLIPEPFTNLWLTKISSRDFVKMRIWSYILWELGSQIPTFSPTK